MYWLAVVGLAQTEMVKSALVVMAGLLVASALAPANLASGLNRPPVFQLTLVPFWVVLRVPMESAAVVMGVSPPAAPSVRCQVWVAVARACAGRAVRLVPLLS